MIKKIILILILYNIVTSCGKKGDPVYKDPQANLQIINHLTNKA
jgi:hypothetical protein